MPLPIIPLALYGSVALASWKLARRVERGRRDQKAEDALDEVQEGMTYRRDDDQVGTTARMRRVFRFSETGAALEIDATMLGRVKIRKV